MAALVDLACNLQDGEVIGLLAVLESDHLCEGGRTAC